MMRNLTKQAVNKGTKVSQRISKGDAKETSTPKKGLFQSLFQSVKKDKTASHAKSEPNKQQVAENKNASGKVKSDEDRKSDQAKNDTGDKKVAKNEESKAGQADKKSQTKAAKNAGGDHVPPNIGGATSKKAAVADTESGAASKNTGETDKSSQKSDPTETAVRNKNETAIGTDKKEEGQASKVIVKKGNQRVTAPAKNETESAKVKNGTGDAANTSVDTEKLANNTNSVKDGPDETSPSKDGNQKVSPQKIVSADGAPLKSEVSQNGSSQADAAGDKTQNNAVQPGADAAQTSSESKEKADGKSANIQEKANAGEQSGKVKAETTGEHAALHKTAHSVPDSEKVAKPSRGTSKQAAGQSRPSSSTTTPAGAEKSSSADSQSGTSGNDLKGTKAAGTEKKTKATQAAANAGKSSNDNNDAKTTTDASAKTTQTSDGTGSGKQAADQTVNKVNPKVGRAHPTELREGAGKSGKEKAGTDGPPKATTQPTGGKDKTVDSSSASSSQTSGRVIDSSKQTGGVTASQHKASEDGKSQIAGPGSKKQQQPIQDVELGKEEAKPVQAKKTGSGSQQVEVPEGESKKSERGQDNRPAPAAQNRSDIPNQKRPLKSGAKIHTNPAVQKPETASEKVVDEAVKQARQGSTDQAKQPASPVYVNGKAADTLVKEGGIQSIKAEQMRDKRYREHLASFAKRASLSTGDSGGKSTTITAAPSGSDKLNATPPIDLQSTDSLLTAKFKADDQSQFWKESSSDDLDFKNQRGVSQNHQSYMRLSQVPVSNISVKRNVMPGMTKAVLKATGGGKTATENWQKHNFTLDDGKNINLSVRQSDGVIQLKLGSMHSDLNRLLQQYQHQIKEHLEQECGLKIDLQFENSDESNMPDFFNQSSGSGPNQGRNGRMPGTTTSPQKVGKILLKSVRKFGYNRMEWTA